MEIKKGKTYVWHNDAGHGWLAVTTKELIALDIDKRISIFSYASAGIVYLEEDRDARVFIEAYKDKFGEGFAYAEKHDGDSSPIRNMNPYESPAFFDYHNQAWVKRGVYIRCGHKESVDCKCFGKIHEGEMYKPQVDVLA